MTGGARKLTIKSALVGKDTREARVLSIRCVRRSRRRARLRWPLISQDLTEMPQTWTSGRLHLRGDLRPEGSPLRGQGGMHPPLFVR